LYRCRGVGPGVKALTKGTKLLTRAARDAKRAERAVEAGKDAERGADAARDAKRAQEGAEDLPEGAAGRRRDPNEPEPEDVQSCPGGQCGIPGKSCFAAGTLVWTQHGPRPIERVQVGEWLWSRDPDTGALELRPVAARIITPERPLLALQLATASDPSELLRVTAEHPFWTKRGWVAAGELTPDDEVRQLDNAWAHVRGAQSLPERATVYNFEVADFHTYFVGSAAYWVHNSYTPGGRELSNHSARDSLQRHGFREPYTEVDDIIDNASRRVTQSDGASVYIKRAPGRGRSYSIAVVNEQGKIITAMKNLSPNELRNLGRNYGFTP
jgi:hypothetical protein